MSVAATLAPAAPVAAHDAIRVMIVDDAVVVRGLVSRWIEAEPDLKIVASLRTGREAVDQLLRANPDVVILDIDMPDLDGLTRAAAAARKEARPDRHHGVDAHPPERGDQPEGALARRRRLYPEAATNREVTTSATFRRDLIEKIRQLGARRKRSAGAAAASPRRARASRLRSRRAGRSAPKIFRGRAAQRRAPSGRRGRYQAAAVLGDRAARAADRLLDRRAAGADRSGRAHQAGLSAARRC